MEERNTRCLEQQVDLLRHSKQKTEQSSIRIQANIRHSVMELQEMEQKFEVIDRTLNVLSEWLLLTEMSPNPSERGCF